MNKKEIERVYRLANLDLSNEDIDVIANKYNIILDFIEHIFEVDYENVEMTEMLNNHKAVLRDDEVKKSLDREDALKNAKDTQFGYFSLGWKL